MLLKIKRNTFCIIILLAWWMCMPAHADEKYKRIERPYFHLQYSPKNSESEVTETVLYFTQAYERFIQFINVKPNKKVTIIMYGTVAEFIKESNHPGWMGGSFQGSTIHLQPAGILKEKGVLKTTIEHETAHVFINELTHGNCPLWLSEGFAVYFSGEMESIKPALSNKISTFNNLSKKLQNTKIHSDALQYYSLSGAFVSSLLSKYGQKKILLLLKTLGSGKSFALACRTTYNITEKQLFHSLNHK